MGDRDYGGHECTCGNKPEQDQAGRRLLDWIEETDLVLGNAQNWCHGTWTWERGKQKSAIDMGIFDQQLVNRISQMVINELDEIVTGSDHHMLWFDITIPPPP